jgi:adenylosuccinate lyase
MIPRYSDSLVDRLYSDEWTFDAWLGIERAALAAQIQNGVVPEEARLLWRWLEKCHSDEETASWIRVLERTETHHDVAAFLKHWRMARGQDDAKWLHYGLTSSDLVDTTQALRFRRLHVEYRDRAQELLSAILRWTEVDQPMLGLTHGQPGEPTSIRARAFGWIAEIEHGLQAVSRQNRAMQVMKLSGPMGTFAHNPPEVEATVAIELGLIPMGAGATQILPRSALSLWASSCAALVAACSKVAHDLRLLNSSDELFWPRAGEHVGSSAMPHKNNPIEAEQVRGMARLARGYAAALEADPLWLERDISNSSVERVAVPDLWHTVFHAMKLTTRALTDMELRPLVIEERLMNRANEAWSHKTTLMAIADGESYDEAREFGREVQIESYDILEDARWFTRQYPKAKQ